MRRDVDTYEFNSPVTARFAENAMAQHLIATSMLSATVIKCTDPTKLGSFGVIARLYDGVPRA